MRIYATFDNRQMEVALVRALARLEREAEYTDVPDEADVLVLATKGKGFGRDDISALLELRKKKVLVTDGGGEADEVVRPALEGGKLKVRLSDIAAAVARAVPPDFVIEDDTGEEGFEIEDDEPDRRPPYVQAAGIVVQPDDDRGGALSLKERLAKVIKKDREEAGKKLCRAVPPGGSADGNPPAPSLVDFCLSQAEYVCALLGVKGGVGVSTVAAALNEIFKDYGSLHLEASGAPSGYVYYGATAEEAVNSGRYAHVGAAGRLGTPRPARLLLADVAQSAPQPVADLFLRRSSCTVLVADREEVTFQMTRGCLETLRPDILVVTQTFPGLGNGQEVYEGEYGQEFGLKAVVGVPGSLDDEHAIMYAQRKHLAPCGRSVDLDRAAGEIAAAVRSVLGI